jgi:2-polyprenyl-3-methyl-5-hydroxy-6-metoxy-1,4-benzoquinol methylase
MGGIVAPDEWDQPSEESLRRCPICNGEEGEILHTQHLVVMDDYPLPPSFDVVICSACGMVFNRNSATQKDYDHFYARFSVHQSPAESVDGDIPVWEVSRLQNLTEIAVDCVALKDARILDVGCSSGGLLKNLASRGFSGLVGVDPSPVCVAHVRSKGIEAYQGGANDLPADIGSFDLITLTGVLEHVEDTRAAIASLAPLCRVGGRILLDVPDAIRYADFLHSPFQDFNTEHINHFSSESLRNLMEQFGFMLLREEHVEVRGPSGLDFPVLIAIFERVQKQPIRGQWAFDDSFCQSIHRYVKESRQIMESLNQQVLNAMSASPEVIVWGTGQLAMKMLSDTALKGAKIIAFVDSNPIHSNKRIRGIPILLPHETPCGDWPIIVTSLLHSDGILRVIRNLGLANPVVVLRAHERSSVNG